MHRYFFRHSSLDTHLFVYSLQFLKHILIDPAGLLGLNPTEIKATARENIWPKTLLFTMVNNLNVHLWENDYINLVLLYH